MDFSSLLLAVAGNAAAARTTSQTARRLRNRSPGLALTLSPLCSDVTAIADSLWDIRIALQHSSSNVPLQLWPELLAALESSLAAAMMILEQCEGEVRDIETKVAKGIITSPTADVNTLKGRKQLKDINAAFETVNQCLHMQSLFDIPKVLDLSGAEISRLRCWSKPMLSWYKDHRTSLLPSEVGSRMQELGRAMTAMAATDMTDDEVEALYSRALSDVRIRSAKRRETCLRVPMEEGRDRQLSFEAGIPDVLHSRPRATRQVSEPLSPSDARRRPAPLDQKVHRTLSIPELPAQPATPRLIIPSSSRTPTPELCTSRSASTLGEGVSPLDNSYDEERTPRYSQPPPPYAERADSPHQELSPVSSIDAKSPVATFSYPIDFSSIPTPTTYASTSSFGVSLEALYDRDRTLVPKLVLQCVDCVERFGLTTPHLYEEGYANDLNLMWLKGCFGSAASRFNLATMFQRIQDVHSVATLLKHFFASLPSPLLTSELYDEFLEAAPRTLGKHHAKNETDPKRHSKSPSSNVPLNDASDPFNNAFAIRKSSLNFVVHGNTYTRVGAVGEVAVKLPHANRAVLVALITHLKKVYQAQDGGELMQAVRRKRLAQIWAPILMRTADDKVISEAGRDLEVGVLETMMTYRTTEEF